MTANSIRRPRTISAERRRELAPGAAAAFNEFGKAVFADGALSTEDQAHHRRRRRARHAMPLLHSRPHARRAARRRFAPGTDGSDLGRGGNARRRSIRAFDHRHFRNG